MNSPLPDSFCSAVASAAGSAQAGCFSLKMMFVGLAVLLGKYLVSSVCPAAESLCAGALVSPPKPAPL